PWCPGRQSCRRHPRGRDRRAGAAGWIRGPVRARAASLGSPPPATLGPRLWMLRPPVELPSLMLRPPVELPSLMLRSPVELRLRRLDLDEVGNLVDHPENLG